MRKALGVAGRRGRKRDGEARRLQQVHKCFELLSLRLPLRTTYYSEEMPPRATPSPPDLSRGETCFQNGNFPKSRVVSSFFNKN